jgi:hypothetical protein
MASSGDIKVSNNEKSVSDSKDSKDSKGFPPLGSPLADYPPPPASSHPARAMATIEDDDERLLARIGYRQVCTARNLLSYTLAKDSLTGA